MTDAELIAIQLVRRANAEDDHVMDDVFDLGMALAGELLTSDAFKAAAASPLGPDGEED